MERKSTIELRDEMFQILQKYNFLAKVLGLEPYSERYQFNQLSAIGYMLSAFSIVLMCSGNFVLHVFSRNLRKATESSVGIFGFLMTITHCLHMLINCKRFIALQKEMNGIVNESMCRVHNFSDFLHQETTSPR